MSQPQSLAKLTSISTQTLSLLLERQRLPPSFSSDGSEPLNSQNTLHLPQITKNMAQLRKGILEMEEKEGKTEAVKLIRNQYERMRSMLPGIEDVESLDPPKSSSPFLNADDNVSIAASTSNPSLAPLPPTPPTKDSPDASSSFTYTRYTDDPEAGYSSDPQSMLQTQRQMMDNQDTYLDQLSHSINRQRDLSIQINDEIDVHHGLLQELDTELDRTDARMGGARRRLDRFARGARNNSSTVAIGVLILLLLILIVIFKT
ncbi:hypothetical protein K435DRAFT_864345 [Dendrothele bispora CBS 962.96]|uniref:t-SNARE coiled-coil homology domain-containing protein n=1 Tax=Dendrothele bispora (strain CBS 962.96) TaxID=1314807 RepID=A0A4S8LME5_DENBC|nr:hypothetical protein K435DRAFT_864345 [Dendrothele bispora CBS 962.96]